MSTKNQIKINFDKVDEKECFANFCSINGTEREVFLDFLSMSPGVKELTVKSRIVMTPDAVVDLFNQLNLFLNPIDPNKEVQ